MGEPVSRDEAMHMALDVLGVPRENHAAVFAIHDQIKAWEAAHPEQDALCSGECDHLFAELGAASGYLRG